MIPTTNYRYDYPEIEEMNIYSLNKCPAWTDEYVDIDLMFGGWEIRRKRS